MAKLPPWLERAADRYAAAAQIAIAYFSDPAPAPYLPPGQVHLGWPAHRRDACLECEDVERDVCQPRVMDMPGRDFGDLLGRHVARIRGGSDTLPRRHTARDAALGGLPGTANFTDPDVAARARVLRSWRQQGRGSKCPTRRASACENSNPSRVTVKPPDASERPKGGGAHVRCTRALRVAGVGGQVPSCGCTVMAVRI